MNSAFQPDSTRFLVLNDDGLTPPKNTDAPLHLSTTTNVPFMRCSPVPRLPSGTADSAETEPEASSIPSGSLRILAMDDDTSGLLALTELLRAVGHTVDGAVSGREEWRSSGLGRLTSSSPTGRCPR